MELRECFIDLHPFLCYDYECIMIDRREKGVFLWEIRLDIWDLMLENRTGITRDLTEELTGM